MVKNTGPRPTVTVRDARQADARPIAELIKQAKAGMAGGPGAPGSEKGGLLGKLFGGKGK